MMEKGKDLQVLSPVDAPLSTTDARIMALRLRLRPTIGMTMEQSLNYRVLLDGEAIWFDAYATRLLGHEITYRLVDADERWLNVQASYNLGKVTMTSEVAITNSNELMALMTHMRIYMALMLGKRSQLAAELVPTGLRKKGWKDRVLRWLKR
jgi:hypothetical protein